MARPVRLTFHATLLAVVIGILALAAIAPARQAYEQKQKIAAEQQKLQALKEENARLTERLQRMQDPEYMEKLAREELGLVRDGEISYVVVPPPPSTATVTAPKPKPKPWHTKAWHWVTSLFD